MKVTDYFINKDWKYCEVFLTFQSLSDAHTDEMITKIVVDTLKKYKLKNRLFAMTTNNASNNEKMRKNIKNVLRDIKIEWDHEKNHVSCIAHVIQLAINELLESMKIFVFNDRMNKIFQKNRLHDIEKETELVNTFLKIWYFSRIFITSF